MTIDNKLHDRAWKESAVAMELFTKTKRSPVITSETKNQGNRPERRQESRQVLNLERENTSCHTGKFTLMQ